MVSYLAAVRNYWSLLPAVAVCVGLIVIYAVPTLVNPRWTANLPALFRQSPDPETDQSTALTPQQIQTKRMLAGGLVLGALALVGFNVSLNREANGCYQAARAWGAQDAKDKTDDPCIDMIFGSFSGDSSVVASVDHPQPVASYQLVKDKEPKYLRWIQNRPSYDDLDLLVGVGANCALDLSVVQAEDRITVVTDTSEPCPPDTVISVTSVKLDKPLGDRKVVTAGGRPMKEIDPDLDSWGTVLKKLATGG
jgi:hypothetical protein